MAEVTPVAIVTEFLEENGYGLMLMSDMDGHTPPKPGKYFFLSGRGRTCFLQVICAHLEYDLTLGIYGDEISITIEYTYYGLGAEKQLIGPPVRQRISLADPKSLDQLKRLL